MKFTNSDDLIVAKCLVNVSSFSGELKSFSDEKIVGKGL